MHDDQDMAAEREAAKRNAAAQPPEHKPEPVPEGAIFTVHAFRGVVRDLEPERKAFSGKLLGAVTHDVALEKCEQANKSSGEDVWFGVVPFEPDEALPDPKKPSAAPALSFGKIET